MRWAWLDKKEVGVAGWEGGGRGWMGRRWAWLDGKEVGVAG